MIESHALTASRTRERRMKPERSAALRRLRTAEQRSTGVCGRRRLLPPALAALALAGLALPRAASAVPSLLFAPSTVTAAGVTPSGCTVFFSVSHEPVPWMRRTVTRVEPMVDGDGDGEVAVAPDPTVADLSVWAAVDVENGARTVGAPAGFDLVEVAVDGAAMTAAPGALVDDRPDLELVVIRPGVAAWRGRAFDGAAGDVGAAGDGAVTVRLSDLTRFWPTLGFGGKEIVLEWLLAGDVVVGIDPVRLHTWSFVYEGGGPIFIPVPVVGQAGGGR